MAGAHAEPDLASLVGLRTVKAGHYAQYQIGRASCRERV